MPIVPLPQFEADAHLKDQADREAYAALQAPKTMVVRFGSMKLVGEYAYDGSAKPGCGSKMVVRTHRGTELAEMLTSTCSNSGCSKSVSRKEMLEFIDNSGGRDYPFFTEGRVLRVATIEDLDRQSRIEQSKHDLKMRARASAEAAGFGHIKIVEVEPLLGGERTIVHFLSEERVEFRELGPTLAREFQSRIDFHPVGARDEARLTADYEKCGQYCCCKNFLKVLKPVSMKSAKVQKATLDPLKISGRCGRLMCCLRYEDQTYEELRKRLPHKRTRVGTPEGDGLVIDGQILTQLVLIELDAPDEMGRPKQVAIPVENLTPPVSKAAPTRPAPGEVPARPEMRSNSGRPGNLRPPRPPRPPHQQGRPNAPQSAQPPTQRPQAPAPSQPPSSQGNRHRPNPNDLNLDDIPTDDGTMDDAPSSGPPVGRGPQGEQHGGPRRGRRRRRRGPGGNQSGGPGGGQAGPGNGSGPGNGPGGRPGGAPRGPGGGGEGA